MLLLYYIPEDFNKPKKEFHLPRQKNNTGKASKLSSDALFLIANI